MVRRRKTRSGEGEPQDAAELTRGQDYETVVPIDQRNEQVLLAAAAVDVSARNELARLPPDTFLVDAHRALAAGLREMVNRGLDYDPATLQRIVGDKADVAYLQALVEVRPSTPPNLSFHLRALRWDRQRALAVTGPIASLMAALRDPTSAPERVRALGRHVGDAFGAHGDSYLATAEDVIAASDAAIERAGKQGVYPFGLVGLDFQEDGQPRVVPGAAPGKVTIVTGTSGGGKTTLSAHLMLGIARQRRVVLYGAWEPLAHEMLDLMTTISLADNDLDTEALGERGMGWTRTAVLTGKDPRGEPFFTPARREMYAERRNEIAKWVRFMHNPFRRRQGGGKVSNDGNLDLVQQHVQDSGAEVFVADLWLRCLKYVDDNDVQEALWRQQAMAEEMGVHCVLNHQQRLKDVETRPDKRATREGMKGTSAWVDVADHIFAPHLPALFKRIPNDRMEVLCLKQRNGPWPWCVEYDYDPQRGTLRGGRQIEFDPPGEAGGIDDFVAPQKSRPARRKR